MNRWKLTHLFILLVTTPVIAQEPPKPILAIIPPYDGVWEIAKIHLPVGEDGKRTGLGRREKGMGEKGIFRK